MPTKGNIRESNLDSALADKVNLVSIPWSLMVVENDTYYLHVNSPVAFTMETMTLELQAGACDVSIQINGVNVTGLVLKGASTVKATYTATANNTVAVGDTLTLIVSNDVSGDTLGVSVDGVEI